MLASLLIMYFWSRSPEAPVASTVKSELLPAWHSSITAANVRETGTLEHAEKLRRARDFSGARTVYAQLESQGAMTADAWANYADVLASLQSGRLAGEPARCLEEALRLAPQHAKALWLAGSLAHEEHRYADALSLWRQLRAVLPTDSPDQRIIAANEMEAERLAAREGEINSTVSSRTPPSIPISMGRNIL